MESPQYLSFNIKALKFFGMYPYSHRDPLICRLLYYVWILVIAFAIMFTMCFTMAEVLFSSKDLLSTSINILTFALYFSALTRLIYFNLYDDYVKYMVKIINETFKFETHMGIFDENMNAFVRFAKIFSIYWLFQGLFAGQLTMVTPFFSADFNRSLPIPSLFPFDYKQSPYFETIYFTHSFSMFFVTSLLVVFDGFYCSVALLIVGQFHLLGIRFKNFIYFCLLQYGMDKADVLKFTNDFNASTSISTRNVFKEEEFRDVNLLSDLKYKDMVDAVRTSRFNAIFHESIKDCIEEHILILKMFTVCENFFSPVMLLSLSGSLCYMIFVAFVIIAGSITDQVYLIPYMCNCIIQQLTWTVAGQVLTNKSEDTEGLFNEVPWYLCTKTQLKYYSIIQMRLRKPLKLTAGKYFTMSLENFLTVIRTVFTYITVLKKVSGSD